MKVGDQVKSIEELKKGFRFIFQGVVIFIDETKMNNSEMAIVRIDHLRCEHKDAPELGRDLPIPNSTAAFYINQLERI